ncbi:ABC transporter permease [Christiangramia forsetii]|uniref:FtsX family membrane protein (Predicted permease) n=2 Tax=Christiangramia forsetii TaxID=411153 RepID=A0LZ92_CHRFK|nr:ABC transporter permease [Christiangramia forsetii]GGG37776.1 ABC transporter permease [Christiangramia forsetii]CAL65687.1 FtsX family membrane protein (predicted permease) [Christiangramia forsetii KT0803]
MFKNFIKISWRKIKSDKTFSFINILGLSIGLTITILLFLFVMQERSFDKMYANKDRIYRALLNTTEKSNKEIWSTVPAALSPNAKTEIPEIENSARLWDHNFGSTAFIEAENEQYVEPKMYYADATFFDIFQIEFISGNPATALVRPNTITLSETTAKKYFGTRNALGKILKVDNDMAMEVTGVYKDFPINSSFEGELIASFSSVGFYENPSWSNASFETFFLLNKGSKMANVEKKISILLDKKVEKEYQWYTLSLQPLEKIHLYSTKIEKGNSSKIGSIDEVRNFSLLAILILLIACINYMNLATARSQKSTKDVGINKTLGASGKVLIFRFFIETGFVTLIAIVLAIILSLISIPLFESVTGTVLSYSALTSLPFIVAIFIIWLVTTLVAGSFPALYLSKFSPMEVMKSSKENGSFSTVLRKGLVIVQFSASVILIISVLVIYNQLHFIQNKDLGYNPENILAVSTSAVKKDSDKESLIKRFRQLPEVSSATMAQGYPGLSVSGRSLYKNINSEESINIQTNRSGDGISDVLQLKFLAGNGLPKNKQEGDSIVDVVLNKKAVDYLGISPQEAIGKNVSMQLGTNAYVVGVVDNFNFSSLHSPIGAYAFNNGREPLRYLLIRFNSANMATSLAKFENTFNEIVPSSAFDYSFLDKNVEQMYASERRTAEIALIFAGLAIFVACLGLFGLAAFMAEQRTKEIGVRKVLGASIASITRLLSKDFIKLVLAALVFAFPLAYWMTEKWLQEFAYRIAIDWQIFVFAGIIAIFIAFVTVSFQAIKAAVSNPINSLRND